MNKKVLHTPDGVRDIILEECEQKHETEQRLLQVIASFGYRGIETPSFEFFDVFGREVGTTPSNELFKFFDRDGNTLVLRPDFTPSIARSAVRYFVDDEEEAAPVRLCYAGSTFINHSSYRGRLRESTQIGAELIADPSAEGDAEIVAMVISSLLEAGLTDFQVSLGNVQYFESLIEYAQVDEDTAEELRMLILNKNSFGVRRLLADRYENVRAAMEALPSLFGGNEVLEKAAEYAAGCPQALEALDRLRDVLTILEEYGLSRYVSIDLGMMSNYMYYTGIVFRAYTYGSGDAVVKGGRYDGLLKHFGKAAPSVGFVIVVDQLMSALSRQHKLPEPQQERREVICARADRREGIKQVQALRAQGCLAILTVTDTAAEAQKLAAEREGALLI